jgi:integrase
MAPRRQRNNIFERITKSPTGREKLADITRGDILKGRDRRAETPAAARHFVMTMRGLFKRAVDQELVRTDATADVKTAMPKVEGFEVWTAEDIAAFEHRWPIGTRERVAFDVLLYTGLRRGDAVRVGRPHVRQGAIRLKTEKTGEWVMIVICPELQRTLDAGSCELTFIAGARGKPGVKEAFGEWFRKPCHAAGVKKSAHGLRKAAATEAANNSATERELEAMFGWRGGKMASHDTRSADRDRLAIDAAEKLRRRPTKAPETEQLSQHDTERAPAPSKRIK